jgi:hypothetical protein
MSHRTGTVVLTLLTLAGPVLGAEPPTFEADETLATYLREYSVWLDESPANLEAARQALAQQASWTSVSQAAQLVDAIPKAVDPATSAVERAGLPSFASLFDFGIDSIEAGDEEGSFVVKLNETRIPIGAMGMSATVRQATPSQELLAAVAESSRKAIEGGIEAQLQDLDDITYSVQWGLEKGGAWRVGRRLDLYADELAGEISAIVLARMQDRRYGGPTVLVLSDCEERVTRALGGDTWQAFTREELKDLLGEDELERCLRAARSREEWVVNLDRVLDPLHLIGFLVDNQPQLVVTGLLHDRDPLAGRDGWELKLEYAHGLCNLNKILNGTGCGDREKRLTLSELEDLEGPGSDLAARAQKGHMFTFSARYAEKDELRVDRTFGTGDDAVTLDVLLPEATEAAAKLQYSRNATWNPRTLGEVTVYPKLHVSAEYIDVSDDPKRKDRLVGQITYEIPLTEDAVLPLTLSYANHAELLGDVDHELSAHVGLSYSIDTGKSKKK